MLISGLTLASASYCSAQSPVPSATNAIVGSASWEASATVIHVLSDDALGAPTLNGFTASLARGMLPAMQINGDLGLYRGNGRSLWSFTAGPQFKASIHRFEPFARALFGLSRATGGTAFTLIGGGGVDIYLRDHLSVRAIQMDYVLLQGGVAAHGSDMTRIGVGLTYSFGD